MLENPFNEDGVESGLVEQTVGAAWDKIKTVSDNLTSIVGVYDNLAEILAASGSQAIADEIEADRVSIEGTLAAAQAAVDEVQVSLLAIEASIASIPVFSNANVRVTTLADLAIIVPEVGMTVQVIAANVGGWFEWQAGNKASKLEADPEGGVYRVANSDPTAATGIWVRLHGGTIEPPFFGALGGSTDDTTAIHAMWEFFVTQSEALELLFRKKHITRGFGDRNYKQNYTDYAAIEADLINLVNYDVARIESSGNLYRIMDGVITQISKNGINGKRIRGLTAGKTNGVQLKSGSPAWMRVFAGDVSGGSIQQMLFHGDNPSAQWGGAQNNPDTDLLVYIQGYGFSFRDNTVRFSGGDGIMFKGVVGAFEIEGGECVSQYNCGFGFVFDRISSISASRLWGEGNDLGEILIDQRVNNTDTDYATDTAYARNAMINIGEIYSENKGAGPVLTIRGTSVGIRIGQIAQWNTGALAINRTTVKLESQPGNTTNWIPCAGVVCHLGATYGARIEIAEGCHNNTFYRAGNTATMNDNLPWIWNDLGYENVCYQESCNAAYVPDESSYPDTSLVPYSTHFADPLGVGDGPATLVRGGLIGPVVDFHVGADAAGPVLTRLSGADARQGGATNVRRWARLNSAPTAPGTYWICVAMLAEGHQNPYITVFDSNATADTAYYQWGSKTFGPATNTDTIGIQLVFSADRRYRYYAFPVVIDAAGKNIRVRVGFNGSGEMDLGHALLSDIPRPVFYGKSAGIYQGTAKAPSSETIKMPPASAVPRGMLVEDRTLDQVVRSNGAAWVALANAA